MKAFIAASVYLISVSVGGVVWAHNYFTPREDFNQHVATQLCSKAISDYLRAKELASINPGDGSRQIDLEVALEMVNRVCPAAKGTKV